jgi:putative membrane protein
LSRLLISWIINAVALVAAAHLIDGIRYTDWVSLAITVVIVGLVNALIRPLVRFLTCLINTITLGLFTLVVNALMLWLSAWIANRLGVGFYVDGFIPAFLGALLVTVVSWVLSLVFMGGGRRDGKRDRG